MLGRIYCCFPPKKQGQGVRTRVIGSHQQTKPWKLLHLKAKERHSKPGARRLPHPRAPPGPAGSTSGRATPPLVQLFQRVGCLARGDQWRCFAWAPGTLVKV